MGLIRLCMLAATLAIPAVAALPYRFLLVTSDQWQDPSSQRIEGGNEFNIAASLLRTWGVPYDILRLDQQRLDRYHLLERDGTPRYGTLIFATGSGPVAGRGVELAASLSRDHGVGLVLLSDSIAAPEIAALAGLELVSDNRLSDPLAVKAQHFLTQGVAGMRLPLAGYKVQERGATTLVSRGAGPFLAVKDKAVWLGAHRGSGQLARQPLRDLFKRCLIWAQGYLLYAEYNRAVLIEMHDNGSSEKTINPFWHLKALSEQQFRQSVIDPLKKHGAVLTQVVNTGFVDRRTERVLNPWEQAKVPDALDDKTLHDYSSTKRGLDAGHREGVFEINSHGWTHFLPDLDSAPGPYWKAPVDGIVSMEWYNEFADRLRKQDVPAATQRFHMQRSIQYLASDFGVVPLFLRPPGGAASLSANQHTGLIAASLGFGLSRFSSPYFLSPGLVIQLGPVVPGTTWAFTTPRYSAADVPWTIDGPFFLAFHDRDVAEDAGWFERVLEGLGSGVRFMTANEYTGYLHARVSGDSSGLRVSYDPHYGRFFAQRPSKWVMHVAGREKRTIELKPGLGPHLVAVE